MNILISCPGRTGSTILTKMVKEIAKGHNIRFEHYANEKDFLWADKVLTSKRDIRECMASTKRFLNRVSGINFTNRTKNLCKFMGWKFKKLRQNSIEEECEMFMKIFDNSRVRAEHIFVLENLFCKPEEYIKSLLEVLEIEYYFQKLIELCKIEAKSNHITKSNDLVNYNSLTKDELIRLENFFVDKYGIDRKKDFFYIESYREDL